MFNRYGWVHLSFKRGGKRRSTGDLKLRHHLFEYVPEVVKKSKFTVLTFGTVFSKRGTERKVRYFEIVHFCSKRKCYISVVLRKIENGKLHYYSVRRANNKIKKALKKGLI